MDLSREMSDEEIENLIGEEASRLMQEEPISIRERLMLEARVFNSLRKLDALQELLDDPEISEIMVNGPKHIFYEKAGRVHAWNQAFASEEKMQDVIQQIVGRHNRVVNLSNPIVDTRLAFLENKQVLRLLSKDELNLSDIGIGVNGDGETKTALFCVIPDSDKSYNFIIGMLYTQIFQELYYQADFNCGGRLPIHVTFMLDEFANVALPDDFCSLLSTMRSREISSIIIIQNFAQLKALFKDTWETIPGNCDTFIYLGGNEQSTHKYVSELLGKGIHRQERNTDYRKLMCILGM